MLRAMRKRLGLAVVCLLALAILGCEPASPADNVGGGTTPVADPTSSAVPGVPVDPDLQGAVKLARDDLAGRLGVDVGQIEVVEARAVTWPDGSLGCPQPGMAYPQVLVDGLLIRLRAQGRLYAYTAAGTARRSSV